MVKIIGCSKGYQMVIVMEPHNALPYSPEAKFYMFATWQISGRSKLRFHEITDGYAYFMSILGNLEPEMKYRTRPFENLGEALSFIKGMLQT